MTKFESSVKQIPYPVEDVYRNISDLNNLERVRDRIPEDKLPVDSGASCFCYREQDEGNGSG